MFKKNYQFQLQDFLNNGGVVSKNQIKKTSPVTVYAESTPNPNAMKFVVNKRIVNDIYEFKSLEDSSESPLAKSLFGFEFVNEVFFDFNFVSIIQKIWIQVGRKCDGCKRVY